MWWSCDHRKKQREDERARTQMELALAFPNPYLEKLEIMKQERRERDMRDDISRSQYKSICAMVPILQTTGQLDEEEYKKWLLDETGTYIPKLIKK